MGKAKARIVMPPLMLALALSTSSCALFTRQNAKTVLDAAQVACVMSSFIVDAGALAKVCDVAEEMMPTLREMIAMRQGAQKAGYKYGDALHAGDAGAP